MGNRARTFEVSGKLGCPTAVGHELPLWIESSYASDVLLSPSSASVVNNAYLGLIRQSQRGFEMDYCVQLAFDCRISGLSS